MEALKHKYDNFVRAYKALEKSLILWENNATVEELQDTFLAASIKHFELTYETCWKCLRQYLIAVHTTEQNSPKSVFRQLFAFHIITEDLLDDLIHLADDRNMTSHVYERDVAQEVVASIRQHYDVFGKIIKILDSYFVEQ